LFSTKTLHTDVCLCLPSTYIGVEIGKIKILKRVISVAGVTQDKLTQFRCPVCSWYENKEGETGGRSSINFKGAEMPEFNDR
jgi:hypothetical protein